MPPDATGITLRRFGPVLLEEEAALQVDCVLVVAAHVVEALHGQRVALELADGGAGVDVIDPGHPHPFGDHAERHAVVLLPRVRAVTGAVQVQDHVVPARPVRHRLDRRVADHEIDHHDDRSELLRELGALVHVLHRRRGHVEVCALDLAGADLRLVHRFHAVEEAVAPVHERLRVDVLVVLEEIEPAVEPLVDDAAVVAARTGRAWASSLRRAAGARTCRGARARR